MPASRARLTLLLLFAVLVSARAYAYSVLTHQQIIDLTWQDSIVPALLAQYPNLTPAQLDQAHAYAYGGCAIQDLGYYPFGNSFFSNLTHYARSGDFVRSLFRNQSNANELAFAIGALSHYLGDTIGHSTAINPSVADEFPALAARLHATTLTYEQGRHQHIQTEFAFDVDQVSQGHLAPLNYLNHIGLRIPQPLLAKAFFDTYGIPSKTVLHGRRPTLRVYRFGVRSFLPRIAYAESLLHPNRFPADTPNPALDAYLAQQSVAESSEQWATYRKHHPGFKTRFVAVLIVILPHIGTLRELSLRGPDPQTEQLYLSSVNRTAAILRALIKDPGTLQARIPNRDLDTGRRIAPGSYALTDKTYAKLLNAVTKDPTAIIPTALQQQVLAYYADPTSPIVTKRHPEQWARVQSQLKILATMQTRDDPPVPDLSQPDDLLDTDDN